MPTAASGQFLITPVYQYKSKHYFEDNNASFGYGLRQDGYGVANLRVGWRSPSGKWEVTAHADNLFDEQYLIDAGNGGAAKALFTLAQTDALKVYVYVPQAYSQLIKTGASVDITQAELQGQVFKGTVVRSAGAIDASNRTLQIEVNLPNPEGKLMAGTYVNVAMPTLARQSLTVPTNSLLLRSEGPRIGVVDAGNRIKLHAVTLGADYGQSVEILSGITVKDQLVVNPSDSLADGDVVVVAPRKAPAPVTAKSAS